MTQEFLLDAIVEDLDRLFEKQTLKSSTGKERRIRAFPQDLPIRAGPDIDLEPAEDAETGLPEDDEAEDETPGDMEPEDAGPKDVPEPYIIVRLPSGEQSAQDERQKVEVILVICVYDPDPDRQGFRDALQIVNTIMNHYAAGGLVGRRYMVQYPIKWVTQEEDTHPYYFAAMALTFDAPAIFKEMPKT